jgi:hypothetical protein
MSVAESFFNISVYPSKVGLIHKFFLPKTESQIQIGTHDPIALSIGDLVDI